MKIKTSLKMGLKNLVSHPLRMLVTVILATIALGLLGTSVTAALFDEVTARLECVYNSEENYVVNCVNGFNESEYGQLTEKTQSPIAKFTQVSSVIDQNALVDWGFFTPLTETDATLTDSTMNQLPSWVVCADGAWLNAEGVTVIGRLPTSVNEIAISACQYRFLHAFGYYDHIASPVIFDGESGFRFDPAFIREVPDMQTLVNGTYRLSLKSPEQDDKPIEAVIVGVVDYEICRYRHTDYPDTKPADCFDNLYVSGEYLNQLTGNGAVCGTVVIPKGDSAESDRALFLHLSQTEGLSVISEELEKFDQNATFLRNMKNTFLYIGIGLAVFCTGIIYQFISFSLESNQKDIGILRALGAGKRHVYFIFLIESFLLSLLQAITGTVFSCIMIPIVNGILSARFDLSVAYMHFTPIAPLVIFGLSVVISFLSAFLPIRKAANRSPIEAIRINIV